MVYVPCEEESMSLFKRDMESRKMAKIKLLEIKKYTLDEFNGKIDIVEEKNQLSSRHGNRNYLE